MLNNYDPERVQVTDAVEEHPSDVEGKDDEKPDVPNGVLVTKIVEEDGRLTTSLQVLGDVQITEAQFLLELAIKEFRRAIGLGQDGR